MIIIIVSMCFFSLHLAFATLSKYYYFISFFVFKEKMNNSAASSSNVSITGPVILHVVDAQTSAENGRKFTKYKVSVNYNGQEWDIWRRYKEFHTLNERVNEKI